MPLDWTAANLCDPSLAGYEGAFYVGLVVRYDVPAGWQGFIHGMPVRGGPWPTSGEACEAAERAWSSRASDSEPAPTIGPSHRRKIAPGVTTRGSK